MNFSKQSEDAFRKRVRALLLEEMDLRKREAIIRNLKSIFKAKEGEYQVVEDDHTFAFKIPYEDKSMSDIERAVRLMSGYKEYIKGDKSLFDGDDKLLTFNFVKNPVSEPSSDKSDTSVSPDGNLVNFDTEDRFDISRREILNIIKRKYSVPNDTDVFPFEAADDLNKNHFKYKVDRIIDKNSKDYGKRILTITSL